MIFNSRTRSWTFLTNHGHVLLVLFRNPTLRQRDIASQVGITEGAVHRILTELQDAGYISIERVGRRNHYVVDGSLDLRHPVESGHCVSDLLERLAPVGLEATLDATPRSQNFAAKRSLIHLSAIPLIIR